MRFVLSQVFGDSTNSFVSMMTTASRLMVMSMVGSKTILQVALKPMVGMSSAQLMGMMLRRSMLPRPPLNLKPPNRL